MPFWLTIIAVFIRKFLVEIWYCIGTHSHYSFSQFVKVVKMLTTIETMYRLYTKCICDIVYVVQVQVFVGHHCIVALGKLLTPVCLSPSSIIWYQPSVVMVIFLAGKVTAGLMESNGSLPPGLWLMSPVGWLPRKRAQHSLIEYFYFYHIGPTSVFLAQVVLYKLTRLLMTLDGRWCLFNCSCFSKCIICQ